MNFTAVDFQYILIGRRVINQITINPSYIFILYEYYYLTLMVYFHYPGTRPRAGRISNSSRKILFKKKKYTRIPELEILHL